MIITITLNPALDRTLRIEHPLEVGKLNRSSSSHLEPGGKGINVPAQSRRWAATASHLALPQARTAAL